MLWVLLAILLAHLIRAHNVSWAAFSGYMVMRGHVADSFLRGTLRIVGTAAGAGLAMLLVPAVTPFWPLAMLASAVVGGGALYGALTGRRSYAWLFSGLTFEMILLDKLEHPGEPLGAFATTRLLEVVAGTTACVVVSTLSTFTLRRRWPGTRVPAARRIGWSPQALRHAAEGAVALALLPLLSALFAIPQLAQSAVSIMAVMMVPLTSLQTGGLKAVSQKLLQRTAGCLAGGAVAALCLLAAHGSAAPLVAGVVAGVIIGRHIENGSNPISYFGTQFTLAMLITLVPDSYASAAFHPALDRLTGILFGMLLLEPVLVAGRLAFPAEPSSQ